MTQGKICLAQGFSVLCTLGFLACSRPKELVVLLPDDAGRVGAVAVGGKDRTVVLDAPLAAARIDVQGRVKQEVVTQGDVDRTFATALAAQPPASAKFVLYFVFESTEMTAESHATLEALLAEVARRSAVEVQITGHTDHTGAEDYNDSLSLERAEIVRDMLQKRGLQARFIRAVGRGEREPLIITTDGRSEPRNRRVEIVVR